MYAIEIYVGSGKWSLLDGGISDVDVAQREAQSAAVAEGRWVRVIDEKGKVVFQTNKGEA